MKAHHAPIVLGSLGSCSKGWFYSFGRTIDPSRLSPQQGECLICSLVRHGSTTSLPKLCFLFWDANHLISGCWTLLSLLQSALVCHVLKRLEYSQYVKNLFSGSWVVANWQCLSHIAASFILQKLAALLNSTQQTQHNIAASPSPTPFSAQGGAAAPVVEIREDLKDLRQTSNRPQEPSFSIYTAQRWAAIWGIWASLGLTQKMIPKGVQTCSGKRLTAATPAESWLLQALWSMVNDSWLGDSTGLKWKLEIGALQVLQGTKSSTSIVFVGLLAIFIARENNCKTLIVKMWRNSNFPLSWYAVASSRGPLLRKVRSWE